MNQLRKLLSTINGQSYGAYRKIAGAYQFDDYQLEVVRVQGDPFAGPSLMRLNFSLASFGYSSALYSNKAKIVGLENAIHHLAAEGLKGGARRGSGKSGLIELQRCGQQMFRRSAVEIKGGQLFLTFFVGLPAAGRRVLGKEAIMMFFEDLPSWVSSLRVNQQNTKRIDAFVNTNQRAEKVRDLLREKQWLAFIANGSILARKSGVDDRPMLNAVPFSSPKSMEETIDVDGEKITGMAIPKGITVITGGGFHGKSTLLNALEMGVYNHIPNDGRTLCITDEDAVKVRAEDGRYVDAVDISPFINNLPHRKDTQSFSTENASGSTSQATNIIEAIGCGAKCLLIDEDTSASNFMIRDQQVQQLISTAKEPITAYIERIQELRTKGVSTILVIGGIGDYFGVADHVLMLDEYEVREVTQRAREIAGPREYQQAGVFSMDLKPFNWSLAAKHFGDRSKMSVRGRDELSVNRDAIDLRALEQLVEAEQAMMAGKLIGLQSKKALFGQGSLAEMAERVKEQLKNADFSDLFGIHGGLSYVRKYEWVAILKRWNVSVPTPPKGGKRHGRRY